MKLIGGVHSESSRGVFLSSRNFLFFVISTLLILGIFLSASGFVQPVKKVHAATLSSDDFTGTTIDPAKWTEVDGASGGAGGTAGNVQQNGALTVVGDGVQWGNNGIKSLNDYNPSTSNGDVTIETDVTSTDCSVNSLGVGYGDMAKTNGEYLVANGGGKIYLYYFKTGSTTKTSATAFSCTNNVSFHIKLVILQAGGAALYIDNSTNPSAFIGTSAFTIRKAFLDNISTTATVTFDNFILSGPSAPNAPTALTTSPSDGRVLLNWTAPSGNGGAITDYLVEYKAVSDSNWLTFNDDTSNNTSAVVTGLTNAASYNFRVSATNGVGTGSPTATSTATPNISAPFAPTSFYGLPSDGQIELTWSAPYNGGSAITDYVIDYRIGSGAWTNFTDGTSTNTATTVTGLTNGATYEVRVAAVNAIGTGPVSSIFVTVGSLSMADTFDGTTIDTLKWTEYDSAVGGTGGTVGNVQQNGALAISTGSDSWGTNGLSSALPYDRTNQDVSYQVNVNSPVCNQGYNFVFGYGDIGMGAGTSYAVSVQNGSWILYYWSATLQGSVNITGVTCTANTPITFKLVVQQAGGASVYVNGATTPNGIVAGGTFTNKSFWIQGYNSGVSTTYDNVYVTTTPSGPSAPTNLLATPGDGQVVLNWTAANGNGSAITDYIVQYKSPSGVFVTFPDGTSTSTTATITGLTNGNTYIFKVLGVTAIGTGPASRRLTSVPYIITPSIPSVSGVTITGNISVGETLKCSYTFVDPNGDSEAASEFQWYRADTSNETYSPISNSTSSTYTLTASDLNKYIKVQVTPISVTSPTTGSAVLSSASGQVVSAITYLNHILSTGQSLSIGYNGAPALNTTQPYQNVMLSGTSFTPLVEATVETISSAMANFVTSRIFGNDYLVAVTRHGVGGTAYSGLKKGTTPYNTGMTQTTQVKNAATSQGETDRVIGVTTIHGESDHINGTGYYYEDYLEQWQSDYQTDVQAITGQTGIIPMFTDQMASQNGYNSVTSEIPLAQLAAAEDNPGKIVLVGPKYLFAYSDRGHLTNTSYRWLGEYYGKVIKKVEVDKQDWKPLSPKQITRSGNIIYAKFNVPSAPITFDTSLVAARTNYGFEYYDDSSSASISNVEILGSDTVKITLSTTPAGNNQRLRYAYTGVSGTLPGAQNVGSVGGNLRDSDPTTSQYGDTLYNWSVHFDKTITAIGAPTVSVSTVSNSQTTSATLNGSVSSTGGDNLTVRGFKYYQSTDCTGSESIVSESGNFGAESYSLNLTNLLAGTSYSHKAYATNTVGTGNSGTCQTFTTSAIASGTATAGTPATSGSTYTTRVYGASQPIVSGTEFASFAVPSGHAFDSPFVFDASGSFGSNEIVKYSWDFGDGTTAEGMKVEHQYSSPGRYSITLTMTDKVGKSTTVTHTADANPTKPTVEDITTDGNDLVFKGRSYPKSIVHLDIHSNPLVVQTKTDDKGEWVYRVIDAKKTLGTGDHTVLASASYVLADSTELKSESSKTYDFNVSLDDGKLKVDMEKTKTRTWQYISLGLVLLIVAGFTLGILRKRKATNR